LKENRIAIIGSGIGALSAAIQLAHKNYVVNIFESNPYAGGKLSEFKQGAYRFDAGPSVFTLPEKVLQLLRLAGVSEHEFPMQKLEIGCTYFYEDGTHLTAYTNKEKLAKELNEKLKISTDSTLKYLEKSQKKYAATAPLFIESSLHKMSTFLSLKTVKGILAIPYLGLFKTMHQQNKADLKEAHLVQFFNRYATYNGSNPYQAPAILTMIPHLEHGIGTYFPKNGMIQITNSLVEAAKKLGVQFHFNERVEKISVTNNEVKGIEVNGMFLPFNRVISNMDVYPTYKKLLWQQPAPEKLLNQEKSSSAIIFYWGIKASFKELDLHNIFFSEDYEAEFEHIFKKKSIYHDPTVYVNISCKYLPTDAPNGCENWFVMVNVPPNTGQDWDVLIAETRKNVLQKLSRLLNKPIESMIENESVLDPRLIEERTSSFGGSLYGNASNNRYAAFLRHANFSSKIKGLYFCGGSVHPGGGIPLCISSGTLVAQEILAT